VSTDPDPDLILDPSRLWEVNFQARIETLLKENEFPGNIYSYEETIIETSLKRSRQYGLTKRCKPHNIDWDMLDSHLERLNNL
jgi:hypothetical protein